MNRNRAFLLGLGIGAVALVAALLGQRGSEPQPLTETALAKETSSHQSEIAAVPSESKEEVARAPASLDPKAAVSKESEKTGGKAFKDFVYTKELRDYMHLKTKVFMNEEEKIRKAQLLADTGFVREAGELLRKPAAIDSEDFDRQSRVMDLLFEALESPSKSVAIEALRDVVEDTQIENDKLDVEARRSLAGVKAEVLYQWSALDPMRASDIQAWLPGPVSQKIWRNVLEMQNNNRLESLQEVAKSKKQ